MSPRLCCFTSLLLLAGLGSTCYAASEPDANQAPVETLLAQPYRVGINLTKYLVSEKLDGVRALWDGQHLRSRSGHLIHAPAWFTSGFPAHPLDGELWTGRHQFDQVSAAVRRLVPLDDEWRTISYQVFELPDGYGSFDDRLLQLKLSADQVDLPWLQVVHQFPVADDHALQIRLHDYVKSGGEGLMLHRRDALWQTGRSDALLKLKDYLDAEAKVIAYQAGKGKYQGKMGALLLEMPNGKKFKLGTGFSDALRLAPPELGSVVTYRYRDLTPQGIPRFASFLRLYETD